MKAAGTRVSWLTLSLAAIAAGASAQAPPPPEIQIGPPPVQYNFAPPGARSLGMGASFIGLADDATASESNPAGLTILTKPEFSAHFRYASFDNEVPNTVSGQGFQTFNDKVGSASFFSFVYPWKEAAVSVYYQRAGDFRSHSFFEGVIFQPDQGNLANYDQVQTQFRVENYGLSAAFKLGSKVSIGGSARMTNVKLDALQQTTFPFTDPQQFDGFLFRGYIHPDVSKTKFTWNAGVLLTPVSQVSFGAVYKKGAQYDFSADFVEDTVLSDSVVPFSRVSQPVPIRIPDVYGAGIAVRPTENWTILADVVRVKYSQADPGVDFQNIYQQAGQGGREALADGTELHVGTEYTWSVGSDWLLAVRGGYYSDPDHDGLAGLDSKQNHFTAGGGVVVKNRLQIDIAGNFAHNIKEGLMSFVVRF
ncbi:MAG: OmpP1/FadL family transporter [Vicinamibacteria bacterium]